MQRIVQDCDIVSKKHTVWSVSVWVDPADHGDLLLLHM